MVPESQRSNLGQNCQWIFFGFRNSDSFSAFSRNTVRFRYNWPDLSISFATVRPIFRKSFLFRSRFPFQEPKTKPGKTRCRNFWKYCSDILQYLISMNTIESIDGSRQRYLSFVDRWVTYNDEHGGVDDDDGARPKRLPRQPARSKRCHRCFDDSWYSKNEPVQSYLEGLHEQELKVPCLGGWELWRAQTPWCPWIHVRRLGKTSAFVRWKPKSERGEEYTRLLK